MPTDPTVEPITSLADAQERLRVAAVQARLVGEWLRGEHLWGNESERWAVDLGRIALALDTLAREVQLAGETIDDAGA